MISVVVTTHTDEKYFKETLNSLDYKIKCKCLIYFSLNTIIKYCVGYENNELNENIY